MIYEKIPSLLYECSITSNQQECLSAPRIVLNALGYQNTAISETLEHKRWSLKVFCENKKQKELLKGSFDQLKLEGIKTSYQTLKPNHWLTRWKNQWKPLSLTKEIDVIPFWYKKRYKTSKKVILLDTLMSFGTGMHETTQQIAQLIEDNRSRLNSFLDIGTGTGILSLVAIKHGAKDVIAIDISPLSIDAAKSNFKANDLKARFILSDVSRLSLKEEYGMVAANLITNDLLKYRRKILSLVKPGGLLLVSGISLDNLEEIKSGYKNLPLTCRKISKGKEWAAILYVKKML